MESSQKKVLAFVLSVLVWVFWLANTGMGFGQSEHATGEVLVKFREDVPVTEQNAVNQPIGALVVSVLPEIGVQKIALASATSVEQAVRYYEAQPSVEFAEPNGIWYASFIPNDPYWGLQWGPQKIKAPQAWDINTGNASVKIAILDTGINKYHPDLSGKVVAEYNATGGGNINDGNGHGTHVAGIAAANTHNGLGIAGVGFNSSLMNVKVLADNAWGSYEWIAQGIIWAANNGAHVINMSLGGDSESATVASAVNYAWSRNCVLVAAAGNDNTTQPHYPAAYPNCIAVAASNPNDQKWWLSSYGAWVAVAAPGNNIYSTYFNGYINMSGTSMACPHVSGEAALLWSALGTATSNSIIRGLIESTADQVGGWVAKGRVNAFDALRRTSATWVHFGYSGEKHGTFEQPFQTVAEGGSGVVPGTTLYIKAGSTAETVSINKVMTIQAYGGTVTIGGN